MSCCAAAELCALPIPKTHVPVSPVPLGGNSQVRRCELCHTEGRCREPVPSEQIQPRGCLTRGRCHSGSAISFAR